MEHQDSIADVFTFYDEAFHVRAYIDTERGIINSSFCNFINDFEKLERTRLKKAASRSNIPNVSISKEDIGPSFRTTFFELDNQTSPKYEEEELQIANLYHDIGYSISSFQEVKEGANPNTILTQKIKNVSPLTTTVPDQRQNWQDDSYKEYLTDHVTPILLNLIRHEDFEFGESCPSIELIETHLANRKYVTSAWFGDLYEQYYGQDENIFIGLLRIVEYIGKDLSLGRTMAIAAIAHTNDEVKELGIRILEADCTAETLGILKNLEVTNPWLVAYVKQVISDFEKQLQ